MNGACEFNLSPRAAIERQRELRNRVVLRDDFKDIRWVAGVDVGFENNGQMTRAAVAVLHFPSLALRDHAIARVPTAFPYIPGLLSFRELPAVLEALDALRVTPDLIMCDGQGYAHPRRLGIACHLGLCLDRPTIGVAKSRLVGAYPPLAEHKGALVPLCDHDERVGSVVRTRDGVRPLFVSPGHRVSMETSVAWVMRCLTRFRLPETTRLAHRYASLK